VTTFLVVNFSLSEGDPRLAAIHWFTDEQVDGMRSLVAHTYLHRFGRRSP
jgi:hypothetical protein